MQEFPLICLIIFKTYLEEMIRLESNISKDDFNEIIEKNLNITKDELEYFFLKNPDFAIKFSQWVLESTVKNKIISMNKNQKDKEMARRRRSRVYWIDFGVNIGSEFNYPHFCVVIKESLFTAIVVPISSVKENTPDWKQSENLIVEIGSIEDLPGDKKPCYALVHQIRTVSKQRLSNYKHNGQYYELKLSTEQMDLIDNAIKSLCHKK